METTTMNQEQGSRETRATALRDPLKNWPDHMIALLLAMCLATPAMHFLPCSRNEQADDEKDSATATNSPPVVMAPPMMVRLHVEAPRPQASRGNADPFKVANAGGAAPKQAEDHSREVERPAQQREMENSKQPRPTNAATKPEVTEKPVTPAAADQASNRQPQQGPAPAPQPNATTGDVVRDGAQLPGLRITATSGVRTLQALLEAGQGVLLADAGETNSFYRLCGSGGKFTDWREFVPLTQEVADSISNRGWAVESWLNKTARQNLSEALKARTGHSVAGLLFFPSKSLDRYIASKQIAAVKASGVAERDFASATTYGELRYDQGFEFVVRSVVVHGKEAVCTGQAGLLAKK
jgi:hypothetical protein